ncbi:protein-disulfide reductase DsbD domain-containing protein [Agriterribacter sp.]|uniref:protein-disulfide reductase DsbD domain-containing protein n=1 Tax=Agriterribacter sp. TaxID=2821509 RepID=UPI002BFE546D|nr:protein-disulfide reductase DsbD domain-containing protein [Agriterribacter sp.]HRP57490.1 protein-disulfide reductase DsbD family protein [Agriterribacter sp.]
MKKTILFTVLIFLASAIAAQDGSARMVDWNFSSKKVAADTYEIRFTADINGKYHMYAQNVGVEGPVATSFTFTRNPLIVLNGKVKEIGKMVSKHEAVWDGDVNYYENKVEFVQLVKLKKNIKTNVGGSVEFMVCDDKECLPPAEVPFKINIGG